MEDGPMGRGGGEPADVMWTPSEAGGYPLCRTNDGGGVVRGAATRGDGHGATREISRGGAFLERSPEREAAEAALPVTIVPDSLRSITREQFLLDETRVVARLLAEGASGVEAVDRVASENLFRYPTLSMVRNVANVVAARLAATGESRDGLVRLLAEGTSEQARQANAYVMMRCYRVVREFMELEVARCWRERDPFLPRRAIVSYVDGFCERHVDEVSWSVATRNKTVQVLNSMLVRTGMKASVRSDELLAVWLDPEVAACVRAAGDERALAAFGFGEA